MAKKTLVRREVFEFERSTDGRSIQMRRTIEDFEATNLSSAHTAVNWGKVLPALAALAATIKWLVAHLLTTPTV